MSQSATEGAAIYMAYLLRYVSHFPVTVAELQKMATAKHFLRLVDYLSELPPARIYKSAEEALNQFKHSGR